MIAETDWPKFLKEYGDLNHGRPTRLGVFQLDGEVVSDYWVEDGLPLIALDTYSNHGQMRIDFLFENYTHSVDRAKTIVLLSEGETAQGLDVSDADGTTTQLRFEDWLEKGVEQ